MLPWRSRRQRGEGLLVVGTKKDMMMMIRVAAKISNPVVGKIRTFLNSFLCDQVNNFASLRAPRPIYRQRRHCLSTGIPAKSQPCPRTRYTQIEKLLCPAASAAADSLRRLAHIAFCPHKKIDTANAKPRPQDGPCLHHSTLDHHPLTLPPCLLPRACSFEMCTPPSF